MYGPVAHSAVASVYNFFQKYRYELFVRAIGVEYVMTLVSR